MILLASCSPPDLPETDSCPQLEWHEDQDGDGFGGKRVTRIACDGEQSAGETLDATDCDDEIPGIHPGADELCNEIDDDCDGTADEDPAYGKEHCPTDVDGDGYGDPTRPELTCKGARWATPCTDCDDADADVNPGEQERCDDLDVDEDCDGVAELDFVGDAPDWYPDTDGDGHGDGDSDDVMTQCDPIPGRADGGDDCDDTDPTRHPGAPELCDDEIDNDCDGRAGELCNIVTVDVATADARIAYEYGDGFFGEASTATDDLTGDDLADIAVGGPSGGVLLFDGETLGDVDGGDAAWSFYGDDPQHVVSPGDVDGDGSPDLALSSKLIGGPTGGAAWIFTGPLAGEVNRSGAWASVEGTPCGRGLHAAGDVDEDGRADLLVGGNVDSDAHLYIVAGLAAGTKDPGDSPRILEDSSLGVGEAALTFDDDGDDLRELLVGRSGLYRFEAPFVSDLTVDDAVATLDVSNWGTAGSLIDAGDLDGDGDGDVLVGGAHSESARDAGGVYVLSERDKPESGPIADVATAVLSGASPGAGFGTSIAAGDFDGDGKVDILTTSNPHLDGAGGYLFLGPITGSRSAPEADLVLTGLEDHPVGGLQIHAVGDVDSDGADELFLTSTKDTGWDGGEGAAWLFRGGDWVRP